MNKKIILLIVLVLVVASIFYLEGTKTKAVVLTEDVEVNVTATNIYDPVRAASKGEKYQVARDLVDPEGYINVDNISISEFIGEKVVLVDFWTYSCINCQRTFPYLTKWYEKYKDQGLVIIGVHTPEFEFEKEYDNVVKATKKWNITYPVVQDNDRQTWTAYNNRYWPRKYLIDIDGFIVYDRIGEGGYIETERKIQELLNERNELLELDMVGESIIIVDVDAPKYSQIKTPELYFGYEFQRDQLGNGEGWVPEQVVSYEIPESIEENKFYLSGDWKNNGDNMELVSVEGKIVLKYNSKKINFVAGSSGVKMVDVVVDGEALDSIEVSDYDLYELADKDYSEHLIEIGVPEGVKVYAFTFG
ncbi:redoxin domain-containing protein [Candidatus Woesearchaeota archaeon]|jgi:thiol-disulfide isomerase/thioredoxin|nr:redoxin domain-containing protein [Candidatus Woesearchaeota archaeon]MBT6045142.1 redoxin domain-containing protein [Candidatus Woesearchaeota archaeon]